MVNFRLTRAQRAATHNHSSSATNSHRRARGSPTSPSSSHTGTRPADEAPYYQIEASINQFAGTAAASSGTSSPNSLGNSDSVGENIAANTSDPAAASASSNHQNLIVGGAFGSPPGSSPSRRAKPIGSSGSGSGSGSGKRRGVLRLLDSPRRKILGRMSGNGGNNAGLSDGVDGTSGTAGGITNDTSASLIAAATPAPVPPTSSPSTPRAGGSFRQLQQVVPQSSMEGDFKMPALAPPSSLSSTSPSSSSSSNYPVQETNAPSYLITPMLMNLKNASKSNSQMPTSVQSKFADPSNILEWLHDEAPDDILPRVLSFAGSRRIAVLSLTSKSWRRLCLSETVWQTACEDTGKYRPGIDPPLQPTVTWLQHYTDNPLVPVDYDTIQRAMYKADACAAMTSNDAEVVDATNRHPTVPQHQRSLRVLLKPKTYVLKEALVVHALGRAEVTIETVDGPSERMVLQKRTLESSGLAGRNMVGVGLDADFAAEGVRPASRLDRSASATSSGSAKHRLRDLLSCRSASGIGLGSDGNANLSEIGTFDPSSTSDDMSQSSSSASFYPHPAARGRTESLPNLLQNPDLYHNGCCPKYAKRRAVLVLKTKKSNEPLVRVRQGTLRLKDVDCLHNANGTDIWNGNAAIQVQPPLDEAGEFPVEMAPPNLPATAYVDSCDITSLSGRGLVTIDGGRATVTNSHVHHCAATGIYIGGPSSRAIIRGTDVVQNGYGNKRNTRRGITRGHSGVYLEQGTANLRDCNVSNNALTGISAVSADNALLDVRDTDLMSNETMQLEMPPAGSRSYRRSISRDNRINQEGTSRSRSGLVPPPEHAVVVSSPNTMYNRIVGDGSGSGSGRRRRRREHEGLPQSPASDGEEQHQVASPH